MIALIQRVRTASVFVDNACIATINDGLLVLLGVEKDDDAGRAKRLVERILGYRVFSDHEGKMNLSVQDVAGDILLVPQFTLAASTRKGMRPSFSSAATPELGRKLFATVVDIMTEHTGRVKTGRFGADMDVQLTNQGPVTFWLQS